MRTRQYVFGLVAVLAICAVALQASAESGYTGPITDRAKICIIGDVVKEDAGVEYKHDGKSYYLCCSACEPKFKEAPEQYTQATDPVSGAKVDKASAPAFAYRGKAFFFENDEGLKKFEADPEKYLPRAE